MKPEYEYFEKDFYPLWNILGLEENCSAKDASERAALLPREQKETPLVRFAWKCLTDPFYHDVFKSRRSIKKVYEAGFYLDQRENPRDFNCDLNFMTTPLDKVIRNAGQSLAGGGRAQIVLLSTGGYSPVHIRHVEIMEIAKANLEESGHSVIGGYLSPSHDMYVSQKAGGDAAMHIEKRVYLMEKALEESDWLSADKWEGYYNECSSNFTDVIQRLEAYLNQHAQTENGIKVCYVFGADNASFSLAFASRGMAVCVGRNGHQQKLEEIKKEVSHCKNIFFIQDTDRENISSTLIRGGEKKFLQENIRDEYYQIRDGKKQPTDLVYAVRNDLEASLALTDLPAEHLIAEQAVERLAHEIQRSFVGGIEIERIELTEQMELAKEAVKKADGKTISLDVHVQGDVNIEASRLFEMSSAQLKPISLVNRPQTPLLSIQTGKIEPGEYVLIEDDIASGATIKRLEAMLPAGVEIKEKIVLNKLQKRADRPFYDIVDMRDFIFGLKNSGLVVTLPNQKQIRVPYVLPYVSPISRARIPFGRELAFSLSIWKLNKWFYDQAGQIARIKDLDEDFRELALYLGFDEDQNASAFMDWHIQKLAMQSG